MKDKKKNEFKSKKKDKSIPNIQLSMGNVESVTGGNIGVGAVRRGRDAMVFYNVYDNNDKLVDTFSSPVDAGILCQNNSYSMKCFAENSYINAIKDDCNVLHDY